ncbi:MAG: flagellar protein FliS [Pseudomonadota bacterium]
MSTSEPTKLPRPAEIMTMLHDEAIEAVQDAAVAQAEGRIEDKFYLLAHASEIISRIHDLLQAEGGGRYLEVRELYRRCLSELIRFNSVLADDRSAEKRSKDITSLLKPVRAAWRRMDRRIIKQKSGTVPQTPSELIREGDLKLAQRPAA